MKKMLLTLVTLCAVASSCFSYTHMPSAGLIAHYACSANALDSSGHNYHLTNQNVTFTKDRFGRLNKAAYFNGIDAFLSRSVFNLPDSISISVWVKPDAIEENAYIFDNGNGGTNGIECVLSNSLPGGIGGGTGNQIAGFNGGNLFYSNSYTVTDTAWKHVVTTIKNDQYSFYVNDTLVSQGTLAMNAPTDTFMIGAGYSASHIVEQFFTGALDDIRIYNRPLTAQEVDTLYHETLPIVNNVASVTTADINIYPNPATSYIRVEYPGYAGGEYQVALSDLTGKTLFSKPINTGKADIDVSSFAKGLYFLSINDNKNKFSIVKKISIN